MSFVDASVLHWSTVTIWWRLKFGGNTQNLTDSQTLQYGKPVLSIIKLTVTTQQVPGTIGIWADATVRNIFAISYSSRHFKSRRTWAAACDQRRLDLRLGNSRPIRLSQPGDARAVGTNCLVKYKCRRVRHRLRHGARSTFSVANNNYNISSFLH